MVRYSRWWPRVLIGLAAFLLAGGVVTALVIWQGRSSSTQEVLDPKALRDAAEGVISNTASIAEGWTSQDISADIATLMIAQQESLALLSGEVARTRDLIGELESRQDSDEEGSYKELERVLASLSAAQSLLEAALQEVGVLVSDLEPLSTADTAYRRGRAALVAAVESHNQAVASGSTSFTASREEATSAIALLDEAAAAIQTTQSEGLDLGAPVSAVSELESAAEGFVEACRKGESEDIEEHNALMAEVQSKLSAAPTSILSFIDISSWLRPRLENLMQPVLYDLEETLELLSAIREGSRCHTEAIQFA